ncbi:MAG: choice-of-anchor D domain-containing protein [Muribaculaceae bacterium]|nr:choice-of-anchor D domain-containing protein [Muribaculaceae bacterium]
MKITAIRLLLAAVAVAMSLPASAHSITAAVSGTGAPGSEATLVISLSSDAPVGALQVTFPGLGQLASVAEGAASATGRAAALTATAGTRSDGSLTLLLFSPSMLPIAAGDGEVARVALCVADTPAALTIAPQVKATDIEGNEVGCSAEPFTFSVDAAQADFPAGRAYDFGRVPIRSAYTMAVPVHNSGTTPLIIDGIAFSHAALSAAPGVLPLTVGPGESADCVLTFAPEERGTFSATATLSGNSTSGSDVLRIIAEPYAVNEVRLGDVEGICDSTVHIPVSMSNMDPVSGFTLEFELPESVEYVDGSFALSGRATDHTVTAVCRGNRLHATCFSLTDAPFSGHDGEVASFSLRLTGSSSASLAPSKAVLPAVVGGVVTDVLSAIYPGTVSISYPALGIGSAELSLGRTPVTATATAELALSNYGSSPLVIERIVFDGDRGGELIHGATLPLTIDPWESATVPVQCSSTAEGEISSRMSIYSNDPERRMVDIDVWAVRFAPNELIFDASAPASGDEQCNLVVILDSYDPLCAVQFDIEYPDGFTPETPVFEGRALGFNAEVRSIGPRKLRLFCFSLEGASMAPGKGKILKLPFAIGELPVLQTYAFRIENIKISDAAMSNRHSGEDVYEPSFFYNPVLGLTPATADADAPIEYFTPAGVRVDSPSRGIYIRRQGSTVMKIVR